MRRIAPTIPVPANMLRHFAVLTVVLTAGIAMFASGENQSYLAEQVKQREMKNDALRAERQKASEHTVMVDGLRVAPGTRLSNSDVGGDSAPPVNVVPADPRPMADMMPQSASGPVGPGEIGPNWRDVKGMRVPSPAVYMRMRAKSGPPQSQTGHARPTEKDIKAMIEASAQRSGRTGAE